MSKKPAFGLPYFTNIYGPEADLSTEYKQKLISARDDRFWLSLPTSFRISTSFNWYQSI